MSLAEQLKKNDSAPQKEYSELETSFGIIKQGIEKHLKKISAYTRSAAGYYCVGGYETDPDITLPSGSVFFIMEDLGSMQDKILAARGRHFSNGDGTLQILTRKEFAWLIHQLNAYFKGEGLSFQATMKDIGLQQIECGTKADWFGPCLRKNVYAKVPAYGIYLEISW